MHKVGNVGTIFTVLNHHCSILLANNGCVKLSKLRSLLELFTYSVNFSCVSITYTNKYSSWKLWALILICSISLKHEGLRRDEETLQPSIYLNKYVSFILQALLLCSHAPYCFMSKKNAPYCSPFVHKCFTLWPIPYRFSLNC
jgi:hypothetical protein